MPYKAQPVPPIYQPEVAADAIVFASRNRRREIYVGMPTVIAIIGNKLFPKLGDFYLGKKGIQSQQTSERSDPNQPNNLFEPVVGDRGAHGRFDDRAHSFSWQLWVDKNQRWFAMAGWAALAAIGFRWLVSRRDRS
jgi:hypothetical protein